MHPAKHDRTGPNVALDCFPLAWKVESGRKLNPFRRERIAAAFISVDRSFTSELETERIVREVPSNWQTAALNPNRNVPGHWRSNVRSWSYSGRGETLLHTVSSSQRLKFRVIVGLIDLNDQNGRLS